MTAAGKLNRAAWAEWYRTELSRDLYMLSAAYANVMAEVQDKVTIWLLHESAQSKDKAHYAEQLQQSCLLQK